MSVHTAALLVVATMVGTGVFAQAGTLIDRTHSLPAVLMVWFLGGVTAVFGALAYAELTAAVPANGGEYRMLTRVFNRPLGFVGAWTSFVVGFAAPMAASSVLFEAYAYKALGFEVFPPKVLALLLIVALSMLHAVSARGFEGFQNIFTVGKIVLISVFIAGGLWLGRMSRLGEGSTDALLPAMTKPGFAVGLIIVSYAYSGWNAAAYVAGEVKNPAKNLPRALAGGTALVMALYLLLNLVFLTSTDAASLVAAKETVGYEAAVSLFGRGAAQLFSAMLAIGLISAVGALVATGPFIYASVGEDYPRLRFLSARRSGGGPYVAITLQAMLAMIMVFSSGLEAIFEYSGIALSLVAGATVYGVFHLRKTEPNLPRPYRTWGHPYTTIIFLLLTAWMVIYSAYDTGPAALWSAVTLIVGGIFYLCAGKYDPHPGTLTADLPKSEAEPHHASP